MFILDDKYAFFMYLISPRHYWSKKKAKDMKSSCWLSMWRCQRRENIDDGYGREVYRIYLLIYANNNFRFSFHSSKRKLTRVCCRCSTSSTMIFLLQSRRLSLQSLSDVICFSFLQYFLRVLKNQWNLSFSQLHLEINLFILYFYLFYFLPSLFSSSSSK